MARSTRRRPTAAATESEAEVANETTEATPDTSEAPAQSESQGEETAVTTEVEETQTETQPAEVEGEKPAEVEGEKPAEVEGEKPAEDPVAEIMRFAEEVVAERDPQTAVLPTAHVAKFGEKYRALDAGNKRSVRAAISAKVGELLDDDSDQVMTSMMAAKAYNELMGETKKAATAKAAAPKVDPTEAYVESYMAIALAGMALPTPDEVNKEKANEAIQNLVVAYQTPGTDEHEVFSKYITWVRAENKEERGEAPEVPGYVQKAVKIAEGKAAGRTRRASTRTSSGGGGRVGGGRNIAKHVQEAMAEHEIGEFVSIADICKFTSSEYGDSKPSAGAVSARLFPNCNIEGIEGVSAEDSPSGKKGAKRVA